MSGSNPAPTSSTVGKRVPQKQRVQARSYFNTRRRHLVTTTSVGGVGGPIIKDKLFLYGDYYRSHDHEANSNTLTIPPPQWYTPKCARLIDLSGPLQATARDKSTIRRPAMLLEQDVRPFPITQIPFSRVNPVFPCAPEVAAGA